MIRCSTGTRGRRRNFIDFGEYFPGATPYALETNYRCPSDVVDGASSLLSYCSERIDKVIRSAQAPAETAGNGRSPVDGLVTLRDPPGQLATTAVRVIGE